MTTQEAAIRVYSAQGANIVKALMSGLVHVQPWLNSAAFRLDEPSRSLHRRAYEYIAAEYEIRTGNAMAGAPIFVTPYLDKARAALLKKTGRLLTLDVPTTELLIHNYQYWVWILLSESFRCGEHEWLSWSCRSKECARASWPKVFDLPSEPYNRQAVVNRLEPGWLVSVD